jgi:AraC-like DNA-binding protein
VQETRFDAHGPMPRPARRFYAQDQAFGRFGMRWFTSETMAMEHTHGHIEMNWLTSGHMDYLVDGRPVRIPAGQLSMFWAGIPHQTVAVEASGPHRQCNIYVPLDSFLHMPKLGALTEIMMGGGLVLLPADNVGEDTLKRWYKDYRSGKAERTDILKEEIALMLRRAAVTGWEMPLAPWVDGAARSGRPVPLRHVVTMVRHILEHLREPLRAEDLAAVVGLHPNYVLSLFSKVMRVPLHKFVVRMRLIHARALLFEGRLSVENVAFECGFSALSQFYVQFRAAYGLTPRQMRAHYLR